MILPQEIGCYRQVVPMTECEAESEVTFEFSFPRVGRSICGTISNGRRLRTIQTPSRRSTTSRFAYELYRIELFSLHRERSPLSSWPSRGPGNFAGWSSVSSFAVERRPAEARPSLHRQWRRPLRDIPLVDHPFSALLELLPDLGALFRLLEQIDHGGGESLRGEGHSLVADRHAAGGHDGPGVPGGGDGGRGD